MKMFRRSELVFMIAGLILILSSIFLLEEKFSLVKFFNLHLSSGDPFTASYYSAATAQEPNLGPKPTPMPSPTPVSPISAASVAATTDTEAKELSIYLVSPINQAVIQTPKNSKTPATLTFKFEIYPKNTPALFELLFKNEVVVSKSVPGSSNGSSSITIPFPEPALYAWRIKALDNTSELRQLIINEKH
jgi:hypothetical protein